LGHVRLDRRDEVRPRGAGFDIWAGSGRLLKTPATSWLRLSISIS